MSQLIDRYLGEHVVNDALSENKIAFVSGPRQVGKTTLSERILSSHAGEYFNWDDDTFKKVWIKDPQKIIDYTHKDQIIVLDEIHKDRKWKSKLKGLYDLNKKARKFLVTGSARLNYYRKSGDSLQGRYFPYRLHPLTTHETPKIKPPPIKSWTEFADTQQVFSLKDLMQLSGFPEPLLKGSQAQARRWRRLHRERMIQEDLRSLEFVREVSQVEKLALLIPEKVGSRFSFQSLREDIQCSADSLRRWCHLLESVYYLYFIRPFYRGLKQSLKKEPKVYLFDPTWTTSQGACWENIVANHLIKSIHAWTDAALGEFELYYLRDKRGRECDFFVTKDDKPYLLLEVKSQSSSISPHLLYYRDILKPKFCIQVVTSKNKEKPLSLKNPTIELMTGKRFLSALN